MKNATDNGKALEKAVHLIQQALLKNDPSLSGSRFTIEWNKRIKLNGTRHEVDVYVVTHPDTAYSSVTLFECKDWKKSVSTKEVMGLKEKVEILGATRGVLVARSLSPDAQALLERPDYNRIGFRRCSEDIKQLFQFEAVHTVHESVGGTVRLTPWDARQVIPENFQYGVYRWVNEVGIFGPFAHQRVNLLADEDKLAQVRLHDSESTHWRPLRERLKFQPGEFCVSGFALASLEVDVVFLVTVGVSSPCYHCSVEGDGHVVSFHMKDKDFPNQSLDLNMVFTDLRKPR